MTTLNNGENGGSGDDSQTFVEELYDKFLECRLCSRTFRQPKMLICQHTFCVECLETHYEMDEQDRPYRFLLSHTRDLSCPCCRTRTPLPTGGVWRLPDNFLVANLADVVRRRRPATGAKTGGGGLCEICRPGSIVWNDQQEQNGNVDETARVPSVKCVDCDKLLCASCAELHRETKVTSTHALFTLSDTHDVECKIHRNETLRFYCEPCEQCVCVLCALHEHNEHEVSSLADGLERHRGTFDSLLDDCRARIDVVRHQLSLAEAFKSSLDSAEEQIRDQAIEAIAAVRRRERELLDGLRKFVGYDAISFLDERDTLGARLAELDGVRELTETMAGRTNVEFLMAKKDINDRLRKAFDRQAMRTPDRVRLGGVHYVAGTEPFSNLAQPTFDIAQLFRSVAAGNKKFSNQTVADSQAADTLSSSSSSSDSETDSEDSDDEDEQHPKIIEVVSELPQAEHVDFTAVSEEYSESEEDKDSDACDDADGGDEVSAAAPATKICISNGVVQRIVMESKTRSDPAEDQPRPRNKKIPDFSRPKLKVTFEDRGTEMEQVETTEAATATTRVVVCDKETYTGYIYLVHKNVATDNLGTADKGTSTATDVTAAYRNVSNTSRSAACTRGTNTSKTVTCDRASSPVDALRALQAQTPVTKAVGLPISQRLSAPSAPSNGQKSAPGVDPPVTVRSSAEAQTVTLRPQQTTSSAAATASVTPFSPTSLQQQTNVAVVPNSFAGSMLTKSSSMAPSSAASMAQVSPTSMSTTSQQQVNAAVSLTSQSWLTANKQPPPFSKKPVTSRNTASVYVSSSVAAATSSQCVTSPSNAKVTAPQNSMQTAQSQSPSTGSTVASVSPTTSTSTTSQQQVNAAVSPTSQHSMTANKQLPQYFQKPVTSHNTAFAALSSSSVAAATTSQCMASPLNLMTSSVSAVSTTSQQKQPPVSRSNVSNASSTAPVQSSSVPRATDNSVMSTAQQKPVTSSNTYVRPLDSSSLTAQSTNAILPPSTTSRPASQPASSNSVRMVSSTASVTASQTAVANSANSIRVVASGASAPTVTVVTAPLLASPPNKPLTVVSPYALRLDTAAQNGRSTSVVSPASQMLASQMTSQTTNVMPERPATTAVPSSEPKNSMQVAQSPAPSSGSMAAVSPTSTWTTLQQSANAAVSPTSWPWMTANKQPPPFNQKPVTSRSIASMSAASPLASATSVHATSPSNVMTSSFSAVSTTPQHMVQMPSVATVACKTTSVGTRSLTTSQARPQSTSPINMASTTPGLPPPNSPTTLSNAVVPSIGTTTQKPLTSLVSSTSQLHGPPTWTPGTAIMRPNVSSQATTTSSTPNVFTAIPSVSTSTQTSLMPVQTVGLQSTVTSTTNCSPSGTSAPSLADNASMAHTMPTAGSSLGPNSQLGSRMTSPTTRPSVFRSMSMDNLRTSAPPIWRPPPPIMSTSVAAVTQRLNGGGGGASPGKNGCWRPNR